MSPHWCYQDVLNVLASKMDLENPQIVYVQLHAARLLTLHLPCLQLNRLMFPQRDFLQQHCSLATRMHWTVCPPCEALLKLLPQK
mmetsp:Transcript_42289/g.96979  ORF Transcript_42289/g.96979 Transcript_42289/m.96979 type:complete len:85 (+) Transcript_42289:769-1023(+)